MAKIIQILELGGNLYGLGDDGVTYQAKADCEWVEVIKALQKTKALSVKPSTAFKPPVQQTIEVYMRERGLNFNQAVDQAGKFFDFYASKGWMVGKNKMKDWKAAVRNWLKNYAPPSTANDNDTSWIKGVEDML